jgi:AcrR family transcriptional regulator
MVKKHADHDSKIALAALRLADKGWSKVTLEAVAKAANIKPADLKQRFATPAKLAGVIAAEIDREAFAGAKPAGTPHDILFDLLMARFDMLQKHRRAIVNMAEAARTDRSLSCALAAATLDGIYRLIAASKLTKPARPVLALGLTGIYGWAFFHWQRDESRDMAKTMAALDRALRLTDKAAKLLTPCF